MELQTQISFDFEAAFLAADFTPEEFTFRGKPYLAFIAPYFGCRLRVRPLKSKGSPLVTGLAMRSYATSNRNRIDTMYQARFGR